MICVSESTSKQQLLYGSGELCRSQEDLGLKASTTEDHFVLRVEMTDRWGILHNKELPVSTFHVILLASLREE
jgi:hypothetical protein